MSDRCYLRMRFHRGDIENPALMEALKFFSQEEDAAGRINALTAGDLDDCAGDPGWVVEGEANFGLFNDREEWSKAGLRFYGDHNEGGEYKAATFWSDGKTHHDEVDTEGQLVVPVMWPITDTPPDVAEGNGYLLKLLGRVPVQGVSYPTIETLNAALNDRETEHRLRQEVDASWEGS